MELLSNTSTVMATMDDNTIALYCEMKAFIRSDSFLIWEGPGGRRITGGTGKHQITFSDGAPDSAANGGGVLVPSRVSTLTITNPEPSDAGTYTCSVMGTSEAVIIELQVNGTNIIIDMHTGTTDETQTSLTISLSNNGTLQLTGIILGCTAAILILTGSVVIVAAEVYCHMCTKKCRKNNTISGVRSNPRPAYNFITLLGLKHSVHHHKGLPDAYESRQLQQNHKDDLNVNTVERNCVNDPLKDSLNTTEMNVDHGVATYSDVNVAYGLTTDGVNTLETNMASCVADTIMEENEAYGTAIDGIGVNTMERNIAYSAVITQDNSDAVVDCGMDGGMQV